MKRAPSVSAARPSLRRGSIALRLLLVLAGSLAAAELAVRGWDAAHDIDSESYVPRDVSGSSGMYVPHPYLGVVLRPGFEREGPFSVSVGDLGLRGPAHALAKPEGTYRILCLGGSTTFGTAVSGDRHTYPAQLERMLNTLPERTLSYEVWNCGVPGYTTHESLINFALRVGEFEPDAVLVYHAVNDARPIQSEGFRSDYSHFRTSWRSLVVSDTERALLRASRLYAWFSGGPRNQSLGDHLIRPDYRERLRAEEEGVNEEGVATFRRNLEHLFMLVRARGATPFLSTFARCPERWNEDEGPLESAVARLNDEQRALGEQAGVGVFEIETLAEPSLFSDWVHLNDAGSNRHARLVVEQAREFGWLGLPATGENRTRVQPRGE